MRTLFPFAFAVALVASVATAQDWPGWRGADRTGRLTGFDAPETWPAKLERTWKVVVGTGHSTPALVGGRLYVQVRQGNDELVLCLAADTGKELWRASHAAPYEVAEVAKDHGKGPKSSPVVVDGRVFALSIDGALTCLDAETGAKRWRHTFAKDFPKTSPECGTSMSPVVTGNLCVVHVGGPGNGELAAFDVASGERRWSWKGDGPGYASPVVHTVAGTAQIITLTESFVVGISVEDGKLLWKDKYETRYVQNTVTPVVAGERLFLSGFRRGTTAYRLGGAAPEVDWNSTAVSMYMSSPVLNGEHLFGLSEKKKGQFFCMAAKDGAVAWLGEPSRGENAALLDAGDVILALTTDSELIVFKASPKAYEEVAHYTVADSPTWAHPVVSGRAIFVKDQDSLARWVIP